MSVLADLAAVFAQLSLLAFGGANSIVPEMQRQTVDVHHWLGAQEFVALYALAQTAPGPNMMIVSLIGWRVAGFAGALVSTVAVATPASVLTLIVSGAWIRFREKPWRRRIQAGLLPVTVGLVISGAALLVQEAAVDWLSAVMIGLSGGLCYRTRVHPVLVLGAAAVLGMVLGVG